VAEEVTETGHPRSRNCAFTPRPGRRLWRHPADVVWREARGLRRPV